MVRRVTVLRFKGDRVMQLKKSVEKLPRLLYDRQDYLDRNSNSTIIASSQNSL